MNALTVIGPRPVAVAGVDKELESIWKTLAPPTPDEASPVMQASLVNLAAVTGSSAQAEAAVNLMGRLMGRTPGRFLVIESQPDADPPDMQAQVSVLCEKSGERQICCELIRLTALGISADSLPTTAQSFYAPDLPVMVWWSVPLNRPDLAEFAATADRLVIDSLTFGLTELQGLAKLIEQSRKTRTAMGDLNWVRLTPYRQLFAQFFDSADCRNYLANVDSVTIEANESVGRLLAGWLLSRLSHTSQPLAREKITLKLIAEADSEFHSIEMQCAGSRFAVTRTSPETLEARAVTGNETITRNARVPIATLEKLLADEISRLGRDRTYDAAVEAALQL